MNTTHYTQLGQKESDQIFLVKRKGMSQSDIASTLGRHKSTISMELSRNAHRKFHQYLPNTAQQKAGKR